MNEMQTIGLIVMAIVTLGGFVALVLKFVQPINELRVVIQKLIDTLDSLTKDNTEHEKRLNDHDDHLSKLDGRVGKLETKMNIYHHDK
jgi:hypothetical protein